jgi:hypothetical protein
MYKNQPKKIRVLSLYHRTMNVGAGLAKATRFYIIVNHFAM